MEFAISQKWSNCHETKSKYIDWTLGLKCEHRVWPWPWPWPWIFKVKYRICYISAKNGPISMKRKANISIELKASNVTISFYRGHDFDLEFSWLKYGICYLSQKWSDCHEMKSKHIDWTPGLKCDKQVWPWPWSWPLNFEGQMWPWPLITHPWPWIFMVKFWNRCISEWEGWLTLHKGDGSRSSMTMTVTIWWPRSGVWIYQVVTGVTSVVGVQSTHLIFSR